MRRWLLCCLVAPLCAVGCMADMPDDPAPDTSILSRGESRQVTLRFLRFDVSNYVHQLRKPDVLALPQDTQDRLWLLDLDLSNGPNAPRLLDNALAQIKALDPSTLSQPAKNLQRLLLMTPATADLSGTSLAELISLAPLLGIAPEQVLADLMGVGVDDTFLSSTVASQAILDGVISTHPNAQTRLGPITADNPTGVYPVAKGSLPITLADAASDFAGLSTRFGPVMKNGVYHPGFITGTTQAKVLEDDFVMTVKASANALPYQGVDLSSASVASVNSVTSQIDQIFDFDDPNWLTIDGLVPGTPVIESMTFQAVENPAFIPGGRSPLPAGQGDSPAWQLPPWQLERVLIGAAASAFGAQSTMLDYYQPGHTDPLFSATVMNGWQSLSVEANIGSPPPPSYLWDILLEVAQVRLHDGGLAEGQANVEVTLTNVPIGVDTPTITQTIKDNLRADPASLLDVAKTIIDNSEGAADFYYYRPLPTSDPATQGDWLYFLVAGDIDADASGKPVRPYGYTSPGFFADVGLTAKLSSPQSVDGDITHEKVRITTGAKLYAQGKEGLVYEIVVGDKPSDETCSLTVTRVR